MDVNKDLKQEVLLTEDRESGKVNVVAGLDEQGRLKTVPPKQANEPDFMKIDKHSNVLENFLSNYFKQASNPRHTGFYRVAKDGIEEVAGVISGLLKNGGEEGKEFLKEYKVDTSLYERQDVDLTRGNEDDSRIEEKAPAQQEPVKREYKPLDKERIDWNAFAKIGISRENLEKSGVLESMLNYRRSPGLHPITMKIDELTLHTDARLSLRQTNDGRIIPVVHAVRKEPELEKPFYGVSFTKEDKENLQKTGNLGRTIEMNIKGVDQKIQAFVSIDQKTNELVAYSTKNVRIPKEIKGVTLNEEQKQNLRAGKSVFLEGMTAKSGKSFSAHIQINAAERGVVFSFNQPRLGQGEKQGGVRIPNKLGGVELSDQLRSELKKGEVIYVENMIDKKGQPYNAYVKVNHEKEKIDFFKWDPRQRKGVGPSHHAQSTSDTLQKEQISPNTEWQQKQNTSKMKL